ncbi:iron(III) ABC superfamily ATP binding cassette transporter, binding protein [Mycobacterium xenopi 4042]|uniref:Iron(III) ABC superfamily ATP binding cassette transporter, binding protein n=1 Tax=Mycobacterium xenopi 4042 TaxID=1299334 RepID=X7Z3L5_MYCXE|nr:iron(III) ABC superfamily ATP binding cassette transporter, binding protein [Mycobacterium xenopi 4042]
MCARAAVADRGRGVTGRLVEPAGLPGQRHPPIARRGHAQRSRRAGDRGGQTGSDPGLDSADATPVSGPDGDRADRLHRRAGAAWEDNLRGVGAATARAGAADKIVDEFTAHAAHIGAAHDASHYQASIVQLTTNTVRVFGANNFRAACSPLSASTGRRRSDSPISRMSKSAPATPISRARRIFRRPTPTSSTCRSPRRPPKTAPPPCSTATRGASCPPTVITGCSWSTTRYGRPGRAWSRPAASSTTYAGSTPDQLTTGLTSRRVRRPERTRIHRIPMLIWWRSRNILMVK